MVARREADALAAFVKEACLRTPWTEPCIGLRMQARAGIWGGIVCSAVALITAACGGRVEAADCGPNADLCESAMVCCPHQYVCGTGENGCPIGGCCLRLSPAQAPVSQSASLPPPTYGNAAPSGPGPGGGGGSPPPARPK
jgi:hypothetical protein